MCQLQGLCRVLISGFAVWRCGAALGQTYVQDLPGEHAAIQYARVAEENPVARLKGDLDLAGLLRELRVNVDSQLLVFSKTSVQAGKISPRNPRAIYFNDEVAVAWVRGGAEIELAALDRELGTVFYTLRDGKIARGENCLRCHQGPATMGVPGTFVGSVYPGPTGMPDRTRAIITDHRTAFEDRWGGWYVNARRGKQPDRANSVADDPAEPHALRTEGNQNLVSLAKFFSPVGYLSPVSDIVALMTFEHQTQAVNLMTRVAWEARMGVTLDADLDALASYLTFAGEAPLKEPIQGVSSFAKTFAKGQPLREFDLQTRLFKYPLSYTIYSPAFDSLPLPVRKSIYARIYKALKDEDRAVVFKILRETKPDV
jgi:hypothetical protein